MAKIHIEISMISARGLGGSTSSFLKPHWFAVGWIDPSSKYCTKVDSSGSPAPTWNTKFCVSVDETSSSLQGLSLTVEVYRRERIFLREKLRGVAIIPLKEFLVKFLNTTEPSGIGITETGSFQLRKTNSQKPQGLVDVSIKISDKNDEFNYHTGVDEGLKYSDPKEEITLAIGDGPVLAFPAQPQQPSSYGFRTQNNYDLYNVPTPPGAYPGHHSNTSPPGISYCRLPTPPPPPPPSNTGFMPTLFPGREPLPETYINVPPSGNTGHNSTSTFGMGLGAGALAAGAVIFGDDFMSSSNLPAGFESGSLTLSTDPPF